MASYALDGSYSEFVIRAAASWTFPVELSAFVRKIGEQWIVETTEVENSSLSNLLRNINEMRLREIIDDQTGMIRKKVVQRALENVYQP